MIFTSNLFTTRVIRLFGISLCLHLAACTYYDGSINSVYRYMEAHNEALENHIEGKELDTHLSYIPCDLSAYRDYSLTESNAVPFEVYKKDYQSVLQFDFKITDKRDGKGIRRKIADNENHDFIRDYYNYQLQHDIKLVAGNDTIPCTYFQAIQNGGAKDELIFSLGFDASLNDRVREISVLFFDRIFGHEVLQYRFDTRAINSIPAISQ